MNYNIFLEKIILPLADLFVGSSYIKALKNWRKTDQLSFEELEVLQEKKLENLLKFAVQKVPYYKDVRLNGDSAHSWLQNFPIITKEILRNNNEDFLTQSKKGLVKIISSGSSGVRTEVFMNQKDISSLRAGNTHWWEWAGYKIGSPLIQTGITTERNLFKKIKDFIFRAEYINAFALSEQQLENIGDKLVKGNHSFILGYASSLNVIAEYALKHNLKINLTSVISLGDKLFEHYKKNIEKAFNCKVYETYGSSEGFLIASQFDLEYLYINTAQVYLEILDDNLMPVQDGEIGHVVVTRLDNRAMPLIRYKLGDLCVKLPLDKYPLKRKFNYPLMQKVIGRDTDVVVLPDGKKLIVHSFTGVFEHVKEIKQFKVVQKDKKGIEIEFIPDEEFYEGVLQEITDKLQTFIKDKSFSINFILVDFIKPTKSGKPQIIESFLNGK